MPKRKSETPRKAASDTGTGTALQRPTDDAARERIAKRAYELFLARGGASGDDVQDWLQAERELGEGRQ